MNVHITKKTIEQLLEELVDHMRGESGVWMPSEESIQKRIDVTKREITRRLKNV